jgi:beta-lactamase class D/beta-lactamase class D OXA-1
MKRKTLITSLLLFILPVSITATAAKSPELSSYFKQKDGCFILYDLTHQHMKAEYNKQRCEKPIAADSTFKIPLSLMAFDKLLITQQTVFKWDGQDKGLAAWNQNQTPQTWLSSSAVWVSQALTSQLGMSTIQDYLKAFDYGNQDFSGNPGKDDGLTQAWLSSSLKISAAQQIAFLKKLMMNQLPVSQQALEDTKENLFLDESLDGWLLSGKTGSGHSPQNLPEGWFVGFTERSGEVYLFALNFTENKQPARPEVGGIVAKNITLAILEKEHAL